MKYKFVLILLLLCHIHVFAEGYKESLIAVSAMGYLDFELYNDLSSKESKIYQKYYNDEYRQATFEGGGFNTQIDIFIPYNLEFGKRWYMKLGLKGVHGSVSYDEEITEGSSFDDGEHLAAYKIMEYKYYQFGPTVSMNLVFRHGELGLQFFTLYGRVYDGKYEALPYMRDQGYVLNEGDYKTGFDGYNIKAGVRPYASLSSLPFFIFNETYITYSQFELNKKLPVYGNSDRDYSMLSFSIGFGVGLFF